ncbi:unnamed protein product [Effrenium voratum]|uniref:Uncharacterized protein n=1 Tax=Effrenium voratum TaxID=2562239 RepID=A0AA36IE11_9DINO|nr:unnamed protein product [Effrenium voratum]
MDTAQTVLVDAARAATPSNGITPWTTSPEGVWARVGVGWRESQSSAPAAVEPNAVEQVEAMEAVEVEFGLGFNQLCCGARWPVTKKHNSASAEDKRNIKGACFSSECMGCWGLPLAI